MQALPLRYQICVQDKAKIEKAYLSSYKNALSAYCSVDEAQSRGLQAGRANQASLSSENTYLSCPAEQRNKIKQAFRDAYVRGLRDYCQPQNHGEAIRDLAKNSTTPSYGTNRLSRCVQEFPDLNKSYNQMFYRERQTIVDSSSVLTKMA